MVVIVHCVCGGGLIVCVCVYVEVGAKRQCPVCVCVGGGIMYGWGGRGASNITLISQMPVP